MKIYEAIQKLPEQLVTEYLQEVVDFGQQNPGFIKSLFLKEVTDGFINNSFTFAGSVRGSWFWTRVHHELVNKSFVSEEFYKNLLDEYKKQHPGR